VRDQPLRDALVSMLLVHCFRFLGLSYLISRIATPMDERFANPTAYGDLIAMVLAFASIAALRTGRTLRRSSGLGLQRLGHPGFHRCIRPRDSNRIAPLPAATSFRS
jgi:hypothetical protein